MFFHPIKLWFLLPGKNWFESQFVRLLWLIRRYDTFNYLTQQCCVAHIREFSLTFRWHKIFRSLDFESLVLVQFSEQWLKMIPCRSWYVLDEAFDVRYQSKIAQNFHYSHPSYGIGLMISTKMPSMPWCQTHTLEILTGTYVCSTFTVCFTKNLYYYNIIILEKGDWYVMFSLADHGFWRNVLLDLNCVISKKVYLTSMPVYSINTFAPR